MRKQGKKSGRISSTRVSRLALIGIIVAVFALGATAAVSLRGSQAKNSTTPAASAQPNDATAKLRLRVAGQQMPLDPQTGRVRPLTQEEAQKLAAGIKELVNQSTDGLQSVRHADGSVSMDLEGRFQNIAVAKRAADGGLEQSCIDNPESAAAFFEIDPQLVGVKKNASAPRTNSAAPAKGGVR